MNFVIDYMPERNLVIIKVKGKLNFQQAEQYSNEAIKLAHLNDCSKFLFNHTNTKPENTGIYKLHTDGDALEKFGFKRSDKIAIVIPRKKGNELFSRKSEHNAKWSNFKYFDSDKDALEWLSD